MRDGTNGAAKQRSGLLVGVAAGLVSGVACGAVTWLTLADREGPSGPAPSIGNAAANDMAALKTTVDALRDEIARLQLASAGSRGGEAAGSDPAALGPAESASRADVAALAEAVQRLSERVNAALAPSSSALKPDPAKREVLTAFLDRKQRMPTDSFAWWTETQLLEAYGAPSYIGPWGNSGYAWGYRFDESGKSIVFEFVGGRVTNYHIE